MLKDWLVKALVIDIILLFICTNVNPSSAFDNIKKSSITFSNGDILYVGGSGEGNYSKIQDAIDNATDGDTVFVFNDSSPYYENVFINQSIYLIGENRNTTVIDGNHISDVIQINANFVFISGFTLQNSSEYIGAGIHIENNYNYTIIFNNNIFDNEHGIDLGSGSSYNNISDNKISYNLWEGIRINGGSDPYKNIENVIQGNIISHNRDRGIFSAGPNIYRTKIIDNRIFNNGFGGICSDGSYEEICYNEIYSNRKYGISYGGGLPVANVLISNNKIYHNLGYGIDLWGFVWGLLVNFTISGNHIKSNLLVGIRIRWTEASKITKNNIYHNIVNAVFSNSFGNKWDGNYWGKSKRIKMILGFIRPFDWLPSLLILIIIPMFNFDFHPAKEPYDIPIRR